MKIISWNVNGVRSVIGKGALQKLVETEKPDFLCLQETKINESVLIFDGEYKAFWSHAQKAGYSGTAIMTKTEPLSVKEGIGIGKHDEEGRVLTLEFKDFFLVNVYVPNTKRDLSRLPYRHKEWDIDFLKFLKGLEKKKPVVFCGDMNVAHQEIDLANPKANMKTHGFTPEEREGFDNIIKGGFIDTFREFEKGPGHYTWWSTFANCRGRNIGWRIDYFCISKSLRPALKKAFILKDVMGSDHCPVGIELNVKA